MVKYEMLGLAAKYGPRDVREGLLCFYVFTVCMFLCAAHCVYAINK